MSSAGRGPKTSVRLSAPYGGNPLNGNPGKSMPEKGSRLLLNRAPGGPIDGSVAGTSGLTLSGRNFL
jgi:hypothetical protein